MLNPRRNHTSSNISLLASGFHLFPQLHKTINFLGNVKAAKNLQVRKSQPMPVAVPYSDHKKLMVDQHCWPAARQCHVQEGRWRSKYGKNQSGILAWQDHAPHTAKASLNSGCKTGGTDSTNQHKLSNSYSEHSDDFCTCWDQTQVLLV